VFGKFKKYILLQTYNVANIANIPSKNKFSKKLRLKATALGKLHHRLIVWTRYCCHFGIIRDYFLLKVNVSDSNLYFYLLF